MAEDAVTLRGLIERLEALATEHGDDTPVWLGTNCCGCHRPVRLASFEPREDMETHVCLED